MTNVTDPQSPEVAPKDGRLLWLFVDYSIGSNPLEDQIKSWTLGFNNLENTGIDQWQFVGWDWEQDCFTEGHGEVIGWKHCDIPTEE